MLPRSADLRRSSSCSRWSAKAHRTLRACTSARLVRAALGRHRSAPLPRGFGPGFMGRGTRHVTGCNGSQGPTWRGKEEGSTRAVLSFTAKCPQPRALEVGEFDDREPSPAWRHPLSGLYHPRASRLRTVLLCHAPPRAVRTPRSFSALAMFCRLLTPAACICRTLRFAFP